MSATWQVLVPVKQLELAKSRTELVLPMRRALALAMLRDVLKACSAASSVVGVTVVSADTDVLTAARDAGVAGFRCQGADLNADLTQAMAMTRVDHAECGVAIVVSDLPGARADDLEQLLGQCRDASARFVPGFDGGTTILALPAGVDVVPAFGAQSAIAHAAFAQRIDVVADGLRCDVDSMGDLDRAVRLGVGQHTVAWMRDRARSAAPTRCSA